MAGIMTGPEHYREAERLLAMQDVVNKLPHADIAMIQQQAQVHATLAHAAATALTGPSAVYDDDPEIKAWVEVAGTKPPADPDPEAAPEVLAALTETLGEALCHDPAFDPEQIARSVLAAFTVERRRP
ncbi:hypothetical protein ITP53_16745 [Nonomuraea sp. K274]|uniref:Uncharacterized protein n=1 Tax=Nonomuraea cypriaca TaxID=1187855 RepID=A0A931A6W1_9ACTN|nr:hypothetical protein [Nonomuraea cypriaca]MBF8187351.1 hypothetical protein [Nonomuraea cypriaca]